MGGPIRSTSFGVMTLPTPGIMNTLGGSLHDTSVLELPLPSTGRQFSDRRLLSEGRYARVYASRQIESGTDVALKCVHKITTKKLDFLREFHSNFYLSSHPNIVRSFDEAFETTNSYFFTQELAPYGDLSTYVRMGGLEELKAKRVAKQLSCALDFVHEKGLIHFDVCLQNVFVFDGDLSLVKLGDFGSTQREGVLVRRKSVRLAWAPPEVNRALRGQGYHLHASHDAWQLGVLIFVATTGSYPWFSDEGSDRHYDSWVTWLRCGSGKVPPRFRCFTPSLLQLLRGLLEPEPEKRASVASVLRYLNDAWLVRGEDPLDIDLDESVSQVPSARPKSILKSGRTGRSCHSKRLSFVRSCHGERDPRRQQEGS